MYVGNLILWSAMHGSCRGASINPESLQVVMEVINIRGDRVFLQVINAIINRLIKYERPVLGFCKYPQ